jgi:hypothetical protein
MITFPSTGHENIMFALDKTFVCRTNLFQG